MNIEFNDFVFFQALQKFIVSSKSGELFSVSIQDPLSISPVPTTPRKELLGEVTLENVLSLNNLDYLEPLSFFSYPPGIE